MFNPLLLVICTILIVRIVNGDEDELEFERNIGEWQCRFKNPIPKEQIAHSFGYCFNEPSKHCRQHAVSVNGCKRYKNMGLFCCHMQNVNKEIYKFLENSEKIELPLPSWMSKEKFLRITAPGLRHGHIFNFFAHDINVANITSAEEMAAFLAIVMLDTHFLMNMEEHLPDITASQHWKYRNHDRVKYIGRGAIYVRGKRFYEWLNTHLRRMQLNQTSEVSTKSLLDVVKYPEILLFPTTAFRAAGLIWKHSYSYIDGNEKPGTSYKELADGNIDNIAQILYHLKGNIRQLPRLLSLWRRIRLVMGTESNLPKKTEKYFGPFFKCEYEPLCRGTSEVRQTECPPNGNIQQIVCKDCSRPLHIVMIIEPKVCHNETLYYQLKKLIKDITETTQPGTKITFVQILDHGEGGSRNSFIDINSEDVESFLKTVPKSTPGIDIPAIINDTLKQPTSHINKKIIMIITDTLDQNKLDDTLRNAFLRAENAKGINAYIMYYQHQQALQRSLPEHIQSRLYHIDSRDIVEALCNDPEVLTFGRIQRVEMKRNEKRSFLLRATTNHRKITVNLYPQSGNTTIVDLQKNQWKIPFDETMMFDREHNVRDSLNVKACEALEPTGETPPPVPCPDYLCKGKADGNYKYNYYGKINSHYFVQCSNGLAYCQACWPLSLVFKQECNQCLYSYKDNYTRFKGDNVEIYIREVSGEKRSVKYNLATLEVLLVFKGSDQSNEMVIKVEDMLPNTTTVEKQSNLEHFKISCYVFVCILVVACFLYLFHCVDLISRIKLHLTQMDATNKSLRPKHVPTSTSCERCFRQFHNNGDCFDDEGDEYTRLSCDNLGYQGNGREYGNRKRKTRFVDPKEKKKKCKACVQRLDMLIVSRLHFVRLILLIVFEVLLGTTVTERHTEIDGKLVSGSITFLINFVMVLCLTEMLCYTGLKGTARNKFWWPIVLVYCLALSISTEYSREKKRLNCWPLVNDIQGRIVLASIILIALVLLLISVYYFLLNGRECISQTGYTICLVLVVMFLVLVISLVENSLLNEDIYIGAFICTNICLALVLLLFTLAVQAKIQNWKIFSLLFTKKDVLVQDSTELRKQQQQKQSELKFDGDHMVTESPQLLRQAGSQRESFKRKGPGGCTTGQPIKSLSLVPKNIIDSVNEIEDTPTYTLEPVFCPPTSVTSLEPTSPTHGQYDDAFEIIVRTKRPRSASMTPKNHCQYLDATKPVQHHSAELTSLYKDGDDTSSTKSFDVSKFVTSLPPVISFHHTTDTAEDITNAKDD